MIFQYPKFGIRSVQRPVAYPRRPVRISSAPLTREGMGLCLRGCRRLTRFRCRCCRRWCCSRCRRTRPPASPLIWEAPNANPAPRASPSFNPLWRSDCIALRSARRLERHVPAGSFQWTPSSDSAKSSQTAAFASVPAIRRRSGSAMPLLILINFFEKVSLMGY